MALRPPTAATPARLRPTLHLASEQATAASREDNWDNEGGHMSSTQGRVVHTPHARFPYKVVLTHHGSADSARAFDTMREAEAFIRRNTPVPSPRSTLYDLAAD